MTITPMRYWREIPQRYRLEGNTCSGCGKSFFPPRQVCTTCQGREFQQVALSDRGRILSYTVIHVAPSQFTDQSPYAVGIIELEDGVRLTSQIVDCDLNDLKIGQQVRLEFRRLQADGEAGILCYGYKCVPAG